MVALRWLFFQAKWQCTESCLADVSSFFFLYDFPLFSSTPLCFSVFLPFYSSFFFVLPFPFSIPPVFLPFCFSYVLVSLLSFFFCFFFVFLSLDLPFCLFVLFISSAQKIPSLFSLIALCFFRPPLLSFILKKMSYPLSSPFSSGIRLVFLSAGGEGATLPYPVMA